MVRAGGSLGVTGIGATAFRTGDFAKTGARNNGSAVCLRPINVTSQLGTSAPVPKSLTCIESFLALRRLRFASGETTMVDGHKLRETCH